VPFRAGAPKRCENGRHGKRVKLTKFTLGIETREVCSVCVSAAPRRLARPG
jgi:hypothetical protein